MYGQIFLIFAIIGTGYFFGKIKLMEANMSGLNTFVLYCAYPCLIVLKIGTLEMSKSLLSQFLLMLAITAGFFGLYSLIAFAYGKTRKFPREGANIREMLMICPNNGFMGLPVALIVLGEKGLLFMIAQNAILNLYFFSAGLMTLRRNNERDGKLSLAIVGREGIKLILNPNILSVIVGLCLCLNEVAMPELLKDYLQMVGSTATPMTMLIIGLTLTNYGLKETVADGAVLETCIARLVVFPLITLALVYPLPLPNILKAVCVLGFSFPGAATVPVLAEQEGQDAGLAARIVFLSTVFAMVTLPVVVMITSRVFGLA